jgi:hypothetical protein
MSDEHKENRINIKDLPAPETELTKEEAEKIKGGLMVDTSPIHLNATGTSRAKGTRTGGEVVNQD